MTAACMFVLNCGSLETSAIFTCKGVSWGSAPSAKDNNKGKYMFYSPTTLKRYI